MALTISTSTSTGITLTSGDDPVSVTGTIAVDVGYALYGPGDGSNSWTIDNSGYISSADSANSNAIVVGGTAAGSVASALVTNEAIGTISGGSVGVYIDGPGSVVNLASGGSSGTITGTTLDAILIRNGLGTVVNYGSMLGGLYGVQEVDGGSVTNQSGGTIIGGGGAATGSIVGAGIALSGGPGAVYNGGHIAGRDGDVPGNYQTGGSGGNGVLLTTGTLANSGTIAGGKGGGSAGAVGSNGGSGGSGIVLLQGDTLVNNATITGGEGGVGGSLSNGGNGGDGVDLVQGGTLSNFAVITGGQGGSIGAYGAFGTSGLGAYLGADATLDNSGTITGGSGGIGG